MVRPTELLMREHRLIERMVVVLADTLQTTHDIEKTDVEIIIAGVEFFEGYADRTHHGKEEDILFEELSNKRLSDADARTMQELMQEHIWTRQVVGRLASANTRYARGDEGALHTMLYEMGRLVPFYPTHIEKEEQHFFGPAMDYFTPAEQQAMLRRLTEFDSRLIHDHYSRTVEEQERRHRVPAGSFGV
jgi:hemerythrin-like domain-containing protein